MEPPSVEDERSRYRPAALATAGVETSRLNHQRITSTVAVRDSG